IQREVLDLQSNGVIRFIATTEIVNSSAAPWQTYQFMNSDFVRVEKMTDGSNRPITFQVDHQGETFHYSLKLNTPVPPGERFVLVTHGTMAGLIQPTADPGVYQYSMRHWPAHDLRTQRIEVHRLPLGAQLLDKEPAEMREQLRQGRLELAIDRLIPPGDSLEIHYRYRLDQPAANRPPPGT
ncbi:MAG TPA: hypothetical protein VNT26_00690, partial [Candidatus Sulfotelmatobacter sp.]|nr:hypothetical protein [Candidatus Sulfotelmatobacter sp.]